MLTDQKAFADDSALPGVDQAVTPSLDPRDHPGYSDDWTDDDRQDFAAHCDLFAAAQFPEDDWSEGNTVLGPF